LTEPLTGFLKLSFFGADGGSDSPRARLPPDARWREGFQWGQGQLPGRSAMRRIWSLLTALYAEIKRSIHRTLCGKYRATSAPDDLNGNARVFRRRRMGRRVALRKANDLNNGGYWANWLAVH